MPQLRLPEGAEERMELERGTAGTRGGASRMEHMGMTGIGQKGTIKMGQKGRGKRDRNRAGRRHRDRAGGNHSDGTRSNIDLRPKGWTEMGQKGAKGMGQKGAKGMELVQRSHNHILTAPCWGARCAPGTLRRSLPEFPQIALRCPISEMGTATPAPQRRLPRGRRPRGSSR